MSHSESDIIIVFTTVDSVRDARSIARMLVEEGLAACVQIDQVRSVFEWDDVVDENLEFKMSIKTISENFSAIEEKILEVHPYELPEIISIPVVHSYGPFADWVEQKCSNDDYSDNE